VLFFVVVVFYVDVSVFTGNSVVNFYPFIVLTFVQIKLSC